MSWACSCFHSGMLELFRQHLSVGSVFQVVSHHVYFCNADLFVELHSGGLTRDGP